MCQCNNYNPALAALQGRLLIWPSFAKLERDTDDNPQSKGIAISVTDEMGQTQAVQSVSLCAGHSMTVCFSQQQQQMLVPT